MEWVEKAEKALESLTASELGGGARENLLEGLRIWIGSSPTSAGMVTLATNLQTACTALGARVLSEARKVGRPEGPMIQHKIDGADLILMFAATPGVSVEALEICHRSKASDDTTKDRMIIYMPDEYRDGFIWHRLSSYGAVIRRFPEKQFYDSCGEQLFRASIGDIADAKLNRERERMLHLKEFRPTIGIVTALQIELRAVKHILDNLRIDSKREPDSPYEEYLHGTIASDHGKEHHVVAALVGKGNQKAAVRVTTLLRQYPSIDEIFMVGIAGGVPDPRDVKKHVRLGDIVVCDEFGVIQYDMVKTYTRRTEYLPPPRAPSADWLTRIDNYLALTPPKPRYWSYLDQILSLTREIRPPTASLRDCPWTTSKRAIRQPRDPRQDTTRPKIHQGPIASANTVLKSAEVRNRLKNKFNVRAVEMETSGIAEATWQNSKGYFVIRGICDFANDDKNKLWQPYAAAAAAGFARELIESMPVKAKGPKPN